MSWTTIRSAVKTKLDTLTGSGQLLAFVDDKITHAITGFPAAVFEPSGDENSFYTNTENMHIYAFEILVVQEMEKVGRDECIRILGNAVDAVVNAFDSYQTLGGAVDWVEAAPAEWGEVTVGNGLVKYARIMLRCHKLKTVS